MAGTKQGSEKEKTSLATKENKDLLTRRNFIASATAMAAMNMVAGGAQKSKENDSKMPVWSGDLKSSVKQTPGIPTSAKPNGLNMIVIIADTWRADHLGCYGSTSIKTPNLDRLAKEGTVFTDVTTEGFIIPARASFRRQNGSPSTRMT
jgi:glucan phosphoethanolaminetransferase (alkaline phosphatase superfamily)